MTGFGRAELEEPSGRWSVECTSLNRKQLEVVVQIPRDYQVLEGSIRERVADRISRGRVAVSINFAPAAGVSFPLISPEGALAAAKNLREIAASLSLPQDITLDQILRHPAAFASPTSPREATAVWELLSPCLDTAIDGLLHMKRQEGAHLREDIAGHLRGLRSLFTSMKHRAPAVPVAHREALEKRLSSLQLSKLPDEARLASEIALFADRCDISEELNRMESHCAQFAEKLDVETPVGRTLEFLVQELFREVNTTGSKASDSEIGILVVEAKSLLDKIREQLANVE